MLKSRRLHIESAQRTDSHAAAGLLWCRLDGDRRRHGQDRTGYAHLEVENCSYCVATRPVGSVHFTRQSRRSGPSSQGLGFGRPSRFAARLVSFGPPRRYVPRCAVPEPLSAGFLRIDRHGSPEPKVIWRSDSPSRKAQRSAVSHHRRHESRSNNAVMPARSPSHEPLKMDLVEPPRGGRLLRSRPRRATASLAGLARLSTPHNVVYRRRSSNPCTRLITLTMRRNSAVVESLIRFGGHLPKGEYDVDHDGDAGQADAAELHG